MDTLKKETLKAAGVDVENALERFMGKEDFLERMLKKFAADTNYAKLTEAVGKKDPESALQASHTLKGMCGNLSITSLIPLFTRQVELLRAEEYEEAYGMMEEISRTYDQVQKAVAALSE